MKIHVSRNLVALVAIAVSASGCSIFEGKQIDYRSATKLPTLEAPPDLVVPAGDNRFAVPDAAPKGAATFSAYDRERGTKPQAPGSQALLPQIDKVAIERAGGQRWMVVQAPAAEVWPVVKDFWQELGFIITLEMPDAGVMETDWAENRAKLPQEGIRGFLSKALDSVYSTAERDKFRTRLEPGADGRTEIYISHRGMVEVFEGTQGGGDQGQGRTVWQPRPANPELEAEMLRRLMVRFGVEDVRAKSLLAEKASPPQAVQTRNPDNAPGLGLPESFDRAWRRVGLALDRIGFVVEDRDRAGGIYFVRYADPEANTKKEKSFLSKLAFWSSDDSKAAKAQRYQVRLKGVQEETSLAVYQDDGTPANNETGKRIANLLFEQLK